MSKTYSNKSNATRAARKAGLDVSTLAFVEVSAGAWTWAPVVDTYENGDQLVSFSDIETPGAYAPLAKPYRIVQGQPARVASRKASAAKAAEMATLEAAAKAAAKAAAVSKPAPAGETPRHKEFALYGRSAILSPVAFVHKFLDANGKTLSRKDALFQLAQAGVNNHTARTQYQRWFAANK